MSRIYIIVIAIGLFVAVAFPDRKDAAPTNQEPSSLGTFSSTSTHVVTDRSHRSSRRSQASQSAAYNDGSEVVIDRDPSGHFFVDAQVNGMPVHFLVDTGASGVALTSADAQKVGLSFSRAEFQTVGQGASGDVSGKLVTLNNVTMNGKTVQNVSGVILDGGEMSLLGQSFLSRMGKIEISGDRMVIR